MKHFLLIVFIYLWYYPLYVFFVLFYEYGVFALALSRVGDQRHGGTRLEAEMAQLDESHGRAGKKANSPFSLFNQHYN